MIVTRLRHGGYRYGVRQATSTQYVPYAPRDYTATPPSAGEGYAAWIARVGAPNTPETQMVFNNLAGTPPAAAAATSGYPAPAEFPAAPTTAAPTTPGKVFSTVINGVTHFFQTRPDGTLLETTATGAPLPPPAAAVTAKPGAAVVAPPPAGAAAAPSGTSTPTTVAAVVAAGGKHIGNDPTTGAAFFALPNGQRIAFNADGSFFGASAEPGGMVKEGFAPPGGVAGGPGITGGGAGAVAGATAPVAETPAQLAARKAAEAKAADDAARVAAGAAHSGVQPETFGRPGSDKASGGYRTNPLASVPPRGAPTPSRQSPDAISRNAGGGGTESPSGVGTPTATVPADAPATTPAPSATPAPTDVLLPTDVVPTAAPAPTAPTAPADALAPSAAPQATTSPIVATAAAPAAPLAVTPSASVPGRASVPFSGADAFVPPTAAAPTDIAPAADPGTFTAPTPDSVFTPTMKTRGGGGVVSASPEYLLPPVPSSSAPAEPWSPTPINPARADLLPPPPHVDSIIAQLPHMSPDQIDATLARLPDLAAPQSPDAVDRNAADALPPPPSPDQATPDDTVRVSGAQ